MNIASHSTLPRPTCATAAGIILLGLIMTAGTNTSVHAQGQIASGTISGAGSGPYTYSLSFSDAAGATSPIGSVWYAWIPFAFYLPGVPTSASAPAGWSAAVTANSIEFTANTPASYILPGHSLSGFGYQATFSPATLAGTPNSGLSDAYSAGIEGTGDPGNVFAVQPAVTPEPTALMLLISGAAGWGLLGRRKLRAM